MELEKDLKVKEKIKHNLEKENSFLGKRVQELEEKCNFLQEKYRDTSSLEALRGKTLEKTKY